TTPKETRARRPRAPHAAGALQGRDRRPEKRLTDAENAWDSRLRSQRKWALAGLVCGIVACVDVAALPALYRYGLRQDTTGVSAGLSVLFVGCLSLALSVSGIAFGILALRNGGRRMAWTG